MQQAYGLHRDYLPLRPHILHLLLFFNPLTDNANLNKNASMIKDIKMVVDVSISLSEKLSNLLPLNPIG